MRRIHALNAHYKRLQPPLKPAIERAFMLPRLSISRDGSWHQYGGYQALQVFLFTQHILAQEQYYSHLLLPHDPTIPFWKNIASRAARSTAGESCFGANQ